MSAMESCLMVILLLWLGNSFNLSSLGNFTFFSIICVIILPSARGLFSEIAFVDITDGSKVNFEVAKDVQLVDGLSLKKDYMVSFFNF